MATLDMFFPGGVYPQDYDPPIAGFEWNPALGDLFTFQDFFSESQSATAEVFRNSTGLVFKFVGTGFTYDDAGYGITGTLDSIQVLLSDGTTLVQELTGINRSYQQVIDKLYADFFHDDPWQFFHWVTNGNDTMNGSAGDDDLEGNLGDDTLNGGDGDDFIDGGAGDDTYDGGAGFDELSFQSAYWEHSALHGITLDTAAGTVTDHEGNSETFVNFERYRGTQFADVFVGSNADESFRGMGGRDNIDGGGGVDEVDYSRDENQGAPNGVYVDLTTGDGFDGFGHHDTLANIENVRGTNFDDFIIGTETKNRLRGFGGNDTLDCQFDNGPLNDDVLWGGAGNDIYVVRNFDTFVDETADDGSGTDTVQASVNFNLGDANQVAGAVENLTLIEDAVDGTGNNLNNVLTGNALNNTLIGLGGNDTLNGLGGTDTLNGGAGDDTYVLENGADGVVDSAGIDTITSTIARSLAAHTAIERLTLLGATAINGTGNALANLITGNAAANTLSGVAGNDTLNGDTGNDILIGGVGNDSLAGGVGNDDLRGEAGNDALNGGAGNDKLNGGLGVDTLIGGANSDVFVFNAPLSAANRDVVTDFFAPQDIFHLENAIMAKLGAGVHALALSMFRAGAAAVDANDFIVYNKATGILSYDANANAAGGVTQLAVLTNKPTLTAADFLVI